jgi:hypothetical protein
MGPAKALSSKFIRALTSLHGACEKVTLIIYGRWFTGTEVRSMLAYNKSSSVGWAQLTEEKGTDIRALNFLVHSHVLGFMVE